MAYRAEFPDGPQPIATFDLTDPAQAAQAKAIMGPDAMARHFGAGGSGLSGLLAEIAKATGEPAR